MKTSDPILVFGYAFPHRKTYDFLIILFGLGYKNIIVIGAPKKKLAHNNYEIEPNDPNQNAYCVQTLCQNLNLKFVECAHDNVQKISEINSSFQCKTAIISGARIIKREVINIFSDGIVNFHPGKIPETSGLDSFFYSIKKDCTMGVTAHYINHKVDAGRFIFFEALPVSADESIEMVRENLYGMQLIAFRRYLISYHGRLLTFPDIDRPRKNLPLSVSDKKNLALRFDEWLSNRLAEQNELKEIFFEYCKNGNLEKVDELLQSNSYLIYSRTVEGWSGIILGAFWQKIDVVEYLIAAGANPNDSGINGTTVLMYSKTKLLEQENPNISIVKLLVDVGANPEQKDKFGRDIFYYLDIKTKAARRIGKYLRSKC